MLRNGSRSVRLTVYADKYAGASAEKPRRFATIDDVNAT
jgi:hypothetical protein